MQLAGIRVSEICRKVKTDIVPKTNLFPVTSETDCGLLIVMLADGAQQAEACMKHFILVRKFVLRLLLC